MLLEIEDIESAYDYGGYNSHGLVVVRDRILELQNKAYISSEIPAVSWTSTVMQ